MRTLGILAVMTVIGCGGPEKGGSGPSLNVDRAAIESAIRADVERQYEEMSILDVGAWSEHHAPDAIILGSAPDEVWVGREQARAAIEEDFAAARQAGATANMKSKSLVIGVAADGMSAWTADEADLSLNAGDAEMVIPFRITQLYGIKGGEWQVLIATYSVGVPNEQAFTRAMEDGWPALASIPEGIAEGSDGVYTRAAHDLDHAGDFVASISDREDAFVFGSDPDERVVGGAQIREVFGKQIADGHVEIKRNGEMRVGIAPGGKVGWVLANLDLSVEVAAGQRVSQPYRAMLVYADEGGEWRLVQAHFSNGVPDEL
jgi:ketosteroid isomerase-like protein